MIREDEKDKLIKKHEELKKKLEFYENEIKDKTEKIQLISKIKKKFRRFTKTN